MFHLKIMTSQDWCDDYDNNCTYPGTDIDYHCDSGSFHDYDDYDDNDGRYSSDIFYSDDEDDDNDSSENNIFSVGRVTNTVKNDIDAIDATDKQKNTQRGKLPSLKKLHNCFQREIQLGHIYAVNDNDNDEDDIDDKVPKKFLFSPKHNNSMSTNGNNDNKTNNDDFIFDMEYNDNEWSDQNNDCHSDFSCKSPVPEILPEYMTADFSFRDGINNYENHPLNLFHDCEE